MGSRVGSLPFVGTDSTIAIPKDLQCSVLAHVLIVRDPRHWAGLVALNVSASFDERGPGVAAEAQASEAGRWSCPSPSLQDQQSRLR